MILTQTMHFNQFLYHYCYYFIIIDYFIKILLINPPNSKNFLNCFKDFNLQLLHLCYKALSKIIK